MRRAQLMARVAHFYGWTFKDIRVMTMWDFDRACDYMFAFHNAQAKANKPKS